MSTPPVIIGISGVAGSGKDSVALVLVKKFNFRRVAMADPMKRILKDVYAFTDEQLWGPSQNRNAPDERYPRKQHTWVLIDPEQRLHSCACCGMTATAKPGWADRVPEGYLIDEKEVGRCYLTPRYALQLLGSEFGRHCYQNTWVDYCIRISKKLLNNPTWLDYEAPYGIARHLEAQPPLGGVGVPDVRFRNEMEAVKQAGGKVIRIVRPGAGLKGAASGHVSEAEQATIPDSEFDYIIQNDGTLDDLEVSVCKMQEAFGADENH